MSPKPIVLLRDRPRPTRAELEAAATKTVKDVIAPGLTVLFSGINPGLYTAWSGHHFARPGNKFWPALHDAGFTERLYDPAEAPLLLARGYGITNVVMRTTATAAELEDHEYVAGGRKLAAKLKRYRPAVLAVCGIGAYRTAFGRPDAQLGPQPEPIHDTQVWVLPNPSGLNAHYGRAALAAQFRELRAAAERSAR